MGLVAQNMSSAGDLLYHTHRTARELLTHSVECVTPVVKEKD